MTVFAVNTVLGLRTVIGPSAQLRELIMARYFSVMKRLTKIKMGTLRT
jgi:hypothetical protein